MAGDGEPGPLLAVHQTDIDQGVLADLHQHAYHLLAWSATATVRIHAGSRDWLVPPTHALWVPAGCSHSGEVVRPGRGYGILLDPARCSISWSEPTGVRITPLVRELIRHLDQRSAGSRSAAESLLLGLLEPVTSTTFHVPLPTDPRVRSIAEALVSDPADGRDLAAWAVRANSSVRTLTRLFTAETGMPFAQWRAHVRVRAAVMRLARGDPVELTARAVGYRKPAAFSEAFRRITGQHPALYRGTDQSAE